MRKQAWSSTPKKMKKRCGSVFWKRLLGGGHKSIEGPYILYDEESGYYYLFVSYGSLTREGGYQMRVFRSKRWMESMSI